MPISVLHPAVGLHVVETWDGAAYLGTVSSQGRMVTIRSGLVGRPVVLDVDDIAQTSPAEGHPDVEVPKSAARLSQRVLGD